MIIAYWNKYGVGLDLPFLIYYYVQYYLVYSYS